ncbi:MAG TPA: PilZ domain-containing protein [Aquifex aeolicus]|nr:PilZ domain-containing protein [Aquifex aeolicus]
MEKTLKFKGMMSELYRLFKVGEKYHISTKFKELPVKTQLSLSWIDKTSKLLGFSWGRCVFKGAFSPGTEVYINTGNRYVYGKVVSNLGYLVIEFKELREQPEFIKRRTVRVEPDPTNPVIVELTVDSYKLKVVAKDISETGVGVILKKDTTASGEVIQLIQKKPSSWFDLYVHLPKYGKAHAKGRVRNLSISEEGIYIRIGFEAEYSEKDKDKVRKYVLERQQEIIKALKML